MSGEIGLFEEGQEPVKKKDEEPERAPSEPYGVSIICEDSRRSVIGGAVVDYNCRVKNNSNLKDNVSVKINVIYTAQLGQDAPEWPIDMYEIEKRQENILGKEMGAELQPQEHKEFTVRVEIPHGVKYGDKADVVLTATSKQDPLKTDTITLSTTAKQTIFLVKTSIGHEVTVADSLGAKGRKKDIGIISILSPAKLRGYLIVEAMNIDRLKDTVRSTRRAHTVVQGEKPMEFSEIEHYLTPKPLVSGIMEGDIVELIAGPFKGEKARVQQIDESKEEITVELFESMVPIPVTIKGDSVRVLEKDKGARQ